MLYSVSWLWCHQNSCVCCGSSFFFGEVNVFINRSSFKCCLHGAEILFPYLPLVLLPLSYIFQCAGILFLNSCEWTNFVFILARNLYCVCVGEIPVSLNLKLKCFHVIFVLCKRHSEDKFQIAVTNQMLCKHLKMHAHWLGASIACQTMPFAWVMLNCAG